MKVKSFLPSLGLGLAIFSTKVCADFRLFEGVLDGSPYTVAIPADWSGGSVFFPVHGWRPDDAPHEADLDVNEPFMAKLLAEGWAIGRTAFLENGVDHEAHTVAITGLKDWIAAELGPVELLILEGESTAGTLVALIAERHPELADGAIAMAPFFDFSDPEQDSYVGASPQPKVPVIVMSNLPEMLAPVSYAARAESAPIPPALRPVLRPGHVNLNGEERWAALEALVAWIESGEHPGVVNGTRSVPPRETGTVAEGETLTNEVVAINPYYGNAFLGFHPDEWRELGLETGSAFEIEVDGKTWPVLFGTTYGDVPLGHWVAFPTADDRILLVRNHLHAVNSASLEIGTTVKVRALNK